MPPRSLALGAVFLPLFAGAMGCSSAAATEPSQASVVDGGLDAAAPAREACPDGTRERDGTCQTTLTLTPSKVEIAPARDHHTTHVFEVSGVPYLYVIGGTLSWRSIYGDVQRAKINADGSIESFQPAGTLLKKRAGHTTVRAKDKIIVLGGSTPVGASVTIGATTEVGTLKADGSLGDFVEGPKMPEGLMHHTAVVQGDYLFVFGGRGNAKGVSVNQVLRSRLAADGTPGPFEAIAPLAEARSHHMTFVSNGHVYLFGGMTGDPVDNPPNRTDVIRAAFGEGGSLGEWEPAGSLPRGGLAVTSAELFGRQVYVMGGLPGGHSYTKNIYVAPLGEDGVLGAFAVLPQKLAQGRAHVHQTPMFGRYIYSVAGHVDGDDSIGTVEIGEFTAPK